MNPPRHTDTSEFGLESLIVDAMTGQTRATTNQQEMRAAYGDWIAGDPHDYEREYCVDLAQLDAFLSITQVIFGKKPKNRRHVFVTEPVTNMSQDVFVGRFLTTDSIPRSSQCIV